MVDVTGQWVNQNGSMLELRDAGNGMLTGSFCSRKGRAASGKAYRLTGVVSGELVSFHVVWRDDDADLHAITSFSGRYVHGPEEAIHAVWVLSRQFEDEAQEKPTGAWNAFLTNADVFTREDPRAR